MTSYRHKLRVKLLELMLKSWIFRLWTDRILRALGVNGHGFKVSPHIDLVGDYGNLFLGKNSEINKGCFLLAKERIFIGENTAIAYQAALITSANPNGPLNRLSKLYPKVSRSISIGDNSWIGARAVILPGVKIGNYCVIASGAVVNRDVPDYTVVGGVPAKVIKFIDKEFGAV